MVNNSCGGKGIGATQFDEFWKACSEVLLPDASVEKRRHSNTMHASADHSFTNLIKKAANILQKKVDDRNLPCIPHIPGTEWVHLQFIPNNALCAEAFKFTNKLEAKNTIQSYIISKRHDGSHYVAAMTRHYLEWIVELNKEHDRVLVGGKDDNSKVPVGEEAHAVMGMHADNK